MQCQFGEITVRTTLDGVQKQLLLNHQVQGASFMNPPASSVNSDSAPGPGPISACAYALGWLLAGYQHPNASMVMVGLGSGSGAIQLLACCPDVDVTVVEICPEIVQAAADNFPLIKYYQDQGRLHIVQSDAADFFDNEQRWPIGLADAYTGKSNDIEAGYLRRMHERCDCLYLNIIDRLHGPTMMAVEDWLTSENTPVTEIYRADNVLRGSPPQDHPGNWIMTTDTQRSDALNNRLPFEHTAMPQHMSEDSDTPGHRFAHANWLALLDSARVLSDA